MTQRNNTATLILVVILLIGGWLIARGLNGFMGISIQPRDVMPEDPPVSTVAQAGTEDLQLPWIMFDPGAVGIDPDTAAWLAGDYDHELRRFTSVYRDAPEYIDTEVFDSIRGDWIDYLELVKQMGGTAIEFKMFLEFIDFDRIGDGHEVYPEGDPMRARQKVYRENFGKLFRDVESMGLDLVLSSDMVVFTPEFEAYLEDQPAGIDTRSSEFWKAYQAGLDELFTHFPFVDGFQIRVGEAGSFYNRPNWPYRSELWVRDIEEVRAMLTAMLETCKKHDKFLIFRSWTVGYGSVGDLHTDTAVYREVFEGLDDEDLWVSTKWVQGDFYPFTPYNPTLSVGTQKRILEFQARREYEAFSSYPLWIVPYEQYALQRALNDNPNIHGCWIWTMNGGPIRRSPMSLIPHTGDLTWILINARGSAALMSNPWADTDSLLAVYLEEYLDADSTAQDFLLGLLNESHAISRDGLTFPTAVRTRIRGLGTDVPPGIYTYWDLVLASSAVNAILYKAGSDQYDSILNTLDRPVRSLEEYIVRSREMEGHMDPAQWKQLKEGLHYELSLFRALTLHKKWILQHYHYLATGDTKAREAYLATADTLEGAVSDHEQAYGERLDFRAFSFDDAMHEVNLSKKAEKGNVIRWLAGLLALISAVVLLNVRQGFRMSWYAPAIYIALIALAKLDALSPQWALTLGIATFIYTLILSLQYRSLRLEAESWPQSWGALILLLSAGMLISAWRGPMALGYWFWTSPGFRGTLIMIAVLTIGMHIVWVVSTFRCLRRWLLAAGSYLLVLALGLGAFWSDLDDRITVYNEQASLLPNNIPHIYGFVEQFGLPASLAEYIGIVAMAMILVGMTVVFKKR